jgi:hypothetical protein
MSATRRVGLDGATAEPDLLDQRGRVLPLPERG